MIHLTKVLLAARRVAVKRGEVKRMWPGAIVDVIQLWWFRGVLRR